MRCRRAVLLLALAPAVHATPLTPSQGAVAYSGTTTDSDGAVGSFAVEATLKEGGFSGQGRIVTGEAVVEGALLKRSYLENGKCYFHLENGRARAEFGGPCDSTRIEGRFEIFHPAAGMKIGKIAGAGKAAAAPTGANSVPLPTAKLTCAYQDRKIGIRWGEATQYSLAFSNMGSLTLSPAGTYRAGASAQGRYVRNGDKIQLSSGPWAGAIGTIERDRSGEPAIVFHIEENRRPDGVHRVDPYTTRCTKAR